MAVDTLAALEQRVVRAIEMLNREREQRAEIEKQLSEVRAQLDPSTHRRPHYNRKLKNFIVSEIRSAHGSNVSCRRWMRSRLLIRNLPEARVENFGTREQR